MTDDLDLEPLPPEDAQGVSRLISLHADVDRTLGDLVRCHDHDGVWRIAALCRVIEDAASRLSAILVNGDDNDAELVGDLARGARPMLREILDLTEDAQDK